MRLASRVQGVCSVDYTELERQSSPRFPEVGNQEPSNVADVVFSRLELARETVEIRIARKANLAPDKVNECWLEVIARLQAAGLNATSVQNPLTTLPESVASAERVLARQDGPTVFVGHSFSGMIVTEAGVHPNVSALVYVAARAPDAGEDYAALVKRFPAPPASAGIIFMHAMSYRWSALPAVRLEGTRGRGFGCRLLIDGSLLVNSHPLPGTKNKHHSSESGDNYGDKKSFSVRRPSSRRT